MGKKRKIEVIVDEVYENGRYHIAVIEIPLETKLGEIKILSGGKRINLEEI